MTSHNNREHCAENISAMSPGPVPSRIGEERLDVHIYDDHGDPHKAALENGQAPRISSSTWAAIFFLGFTFQPSLSFTISTVFPILIPMSLDVQGSTLNSNWMASSWSLTSSISLAIAGQLSDIFGRKHILMAGQVLLIIGHIVGSTANTVSQLIAAMSILGLGTGTTFVLYPGITELIPNRYRTMGLAWTEANVVPFQLFGPLIARLLLQHATWRWLFYLGIITGAISFMGTAMFYHPPLHPLRDLTTTCLLAELDYVGMFLYTTGLALFLFGLGAGGITYPWRSATVLITLILGAVVFISTFAWSFLGPVKRPLFPMRLFSRFREYTVPVVVTFVAGFVFISNSALIPEQIAFVWTDSPTRAGLYNIPTGVGITIGSLVIGAFCFKIGYLQWQLVAGIAMQTLFTGLFAAINPDRKAMGMVFQALANIPFGWCTFICLTTASLHIPQRDLGLGLGLIGGARLLGGAIGTAVLSTILNNKSASTIPARVSEAVIPLGYPKDKIQSLIAAVSSGIPSELEDIQEQVIQATQLATEWGWNDAFRVTWYSTIPFGIIALLLASFLKDPSPYFTKHTAVTMTRDRLGGKAIDRSDENALPETVEEGFAEKMGQDCIEHSQA